MKVITLVFMIAGCMAIDELNYISYVTTTTTEQPGPPNPYVFSYTAGRYPGHTDRQHSEVSDGSGIVRGTFSYVDPRQQIRTVDYTADQNGFHPVLSHPQQPQKQSAAVQRETQRHYELYNKIAQSHADGSAAAVIQDAKLPSDTASVAYAKQKHFSLFEKIAQDHERIAVEREAERLAFEATSEIPIIQHDDTYAIVANEHEYEQQQHH